MLGVAFKAGPWVDSLRIGLHLLGNAHQLAFDVGRDAWDFAVEVAELRHAGVSVSAMRWMVVRGWAMHSVETDSIDCERRQFRRVGSARLAAESCFVITESGLNAWESLSKHGTLPAGLGSETSAVAKPTMVSDKGNNSARETGRPFYDAARTELFVDQRLVKRFRTPAANQQCVLLGFERLNWPPRIADPLPTHPEICPKRRLQETIRALNRRQVHPLLLFSGDGSGAGILWEPTA